MKKVISKAKTMTKPKTTQQAWDDLAEDQDSEAKDTTTVDIRDYKKQPFEAYYMGSKEIHSPKLKFGVATLHTAMLEDGEEVQFWGAGQLNWFLSKAEAKNKGPGFKFRAKYMGKETIEKENEDGDLVEYEINKYDLKANFNDVRT